MVEDSTQYQSKYLLPHDETERKRLNDQHVFLRKMVYEDRLIYDETINLDPHSRILDSGTGTGAWILDLAKEVPGTVTLNGTDISSDKFPLSTPPNVHLSVASITELPKEWSGTFDLVSQRLLLGGLQASEWPVAVSEMFRVLKPGGTVQVVEVDFTYPKALAGPAMQRIKSIVTALFDQNGMLLTCAVDLPGMLKKAGFVDVTIERKFIPVGNAWGRMGAEGVKSIRGAFSRMDNAVVATGLVKTLGEYNDLLDEMEREWDTEAMQFLFRAICAKRPV